MFLFFFKFVFCWEMTDFLVDDILFFLIFRFKVGFLFFRDVEISILWDVFEWIRRFFFVSKVNRYFEYFVRFWLKCWFLIWDIKFVLEVKMEGRDVYSVYLYRISVKFMMLFMDFEKVLSSVMVFIMRLDFFGSK